MSMVLTGVGFLFFMTLYILRTLARALDFIIRTATPMYFEFYLEYFAITITSLVKCSVPLSLSLFSCSSSLLLLSTVVHTYLVFNAHAQRNPVQSSFGIVSSG